MIKQDRRTRTLLHTKTQDEFGIWGIPGRRPQIVYRTAIMALLSDEALAAGSGPIGGVLFGTLGDADTRVLAYRAIDCQPDDQGGAPFSEAGEAALGRLAETYSDDAELAGLQPVGWYRSRWESAIQLNQDDLRVWNRFFPLPAQISLVLRVQENSPVRAGFFFRPQHGGPVRIDSSYRTFEIGASQPAAEPFARLSEAVEASARETSALAPAAVEPPHQYGELLHVPTELFTLPPDNQTGHSLAWAVVAVAVLLGFGAAGWWLNNPESSAAKENAGVVLRFKGSPQRLKLSWDPKSPTFQQADFAELRLLDGDAETMFMLDEAMLALGERPVPNGSGLVEAQLRLHSRDPKKPGATVAANFVGPAAGDALAESDTGLDILRQEVARLEILATQRTKARQDLEVRVLRLRDKVTAAAKQAAPPQPPAPLVTPQPATAAASQPPSSVAAAPLLTPRNETGSNPAAPPPPPPAFGTDRAPARISAATGLPEPVVPAAAYTGPTSGKFIWTGYLAPGKTITIDGRRASSGSVNGALPGVPVRLSVYPGEFSSNGLSVFSASSRHQSGAVNENRSAQNGWLNTKYVYDPARARDAVLSSAPSEASAFRQLQIAGGERPVSVVVVEWTVVR